MGADALSDVLRAVRLSSAMFFHLDVRAPWVAEAPTSAACASAVLPGAQHVIEYHVVIDGCCWGGLIDEPSVRLDAGDIIAFPQGSAHVFSSAPGMQGIPDLSDYRQPTADQLPLMMHLGENGPADARILCGFSAATRVLSIRCWRRCPQSCICAGVHIARIRALLS